MGPVFYLMSILGCGEGETACEQVAVAPTRYENVDACNRATGSALMATGPKVAYPVVVAQCRRAGSLTQKVVPGEVQLPEAVTGAAIRQARHEADGAASAKGAQRR